MANFLRESAAIISPQRDILLVKTGQLVEVDLPSEIIWELHKSSPGSFYMFSHTHPQSFTKMSSRDLLTLKTWAKGLHPWPVRFQVISQISEVTPTYPLFAVTTWLATVEAKEDWIQRGKEGARKTYVVEESYLERNVDLYQSPVTQPDDYIDFLVKRSYEEENTY